MNILVRLRQVVWIAIVIGAVALIEWDYAIVLAALAAIGIVALETRAPWRNLGLVRPRSVPRAIAFGVLAGLVLLLFSKILLTPAIEALTGVPRDLSAFDYMRGNVAAYLAFLPDLWIGAAICEETIFRAFLIGRIETAFGGASRGTTGIAVVLSSVVFGAAHAYQGPTGMLITGVLGMIFAVVYIGTERNLWINIIAHGVYDTLSLALVLNSWDRIFTELGHRLIPP